MDTRSACTVHVPERMSLSARTDDQRYDALLYCNSQFAADDQEPKIRVPIQPAVRRCLQYAPHVHAFCAEVEVCQKTFQPSDTGR